MRFLTVSAMFAPHFFGGAEYCAYDLSKWLIAQGHEVSVLTAAATPEEEARGEHFEAMRVWRYWMPRPYAIHNHIGAKWQKPLWHLADHLAPGNRLPMAEVLEAVQPDCLLIHSLQGLGHNVLLEVAKRNIPVVYFLHDLGLACINRAMHRGAQECEAQCLPCKLSSLYQKSLLRKIKRLTLCSPSKANLDKLKNFFPLDEFHTITALNACTYPAATVRGSNHEAVRLLYVGRLTKIKGVPLLFDACERLAKNYNFSLTIVGGGPEEETLRAKAKNNAWCTVTGPVQQTDVSNHMAQSDLLCVPSLWAENSPGVVIHALSTGLPVLASCKGGLPELIENEKNGQLIPPGDETAWTAALESVLKDPNRLADWRAYTSATAQRFSQDNLGRILFDIIKETVGS